MKIASSEISYLTQHVSESSTAVFDKTIGRQSSNKVAATPGTRVQAAAEDTVQLSAHSSPLVGSERDDLQDLDPKQKLAWLAIEALVGHSLKCKRFHVPATTAASPAVTTGDPAAATSELHQHIELHSEMEQTSFQAQGEVRTADGRVIDFQATLTMQRSFESATASTVSSETLDPLVVNFGGAPAQLTAAKVSFDLNSDGQPEQVSFVAGGSGFLVLDRNGDGKVNNGGELFGPRTGNGFAELDFYDADGNGWIDESDPVFSKLQIWTQDGLSSLAAKGIGAISTTSLDTPFSIKDSANVLQGNVLSSGVYLSENGAAGTIQQVDLAEG